MSILTTVFRDLGDPIGYLSSNRSDSCLKAGDGTKLSLLLRERVLGDSG
jgi:hypothetical protein